jgi:hypothetical protein
VSARVPLVKGRLPGTLLSLVGLLCAAPAVVWPTHTIAFPRDPEPGVPGTAQVVALWSWGRIADLPEAFDLGLEFGNPAGLVLFVIALVAAAAACAGYGLRRGSDGVLLGVVGTVWLMAHVAADLGQTAGRLATGFYGDSSVLRATTVVGVLQFVAVAILLAALAVMVWRPVVRLVVSGWTTAAARWRRIRPEVDASEPKAPPRVGIATIRDVEPGPGLTSAGPSSGHWSDGGDTGVGFSDDPGSDPTRFRPPR